MRFVEITLENFRSYSKEKIPFPERKDKPLYTFVGKNGAGKTSLFLAMMWALYGEKAIDSYAANRPGDKQAPKNNFDLINSDVRETSHSLQ